MKVIAAIVYLFGILYGAYQVVWGVGALATFFRCCAALIFVITAIVHVMEANEKRRQLNSKS